MHQCKYCKKTFVKESTLLSHACEKKRRMMAEHDKPNRLAFNVWRKFLKYCTPSARKEKTYEDFVNSNVYTGFVKFARHVIDLNPHSVDDFVDFVIRNSVKLDDWTKIWVYEAWIREVSKKESVDRAVERSVLLMKTWSEREQENWTDFFVRVNTNQAVHWIRTGRISPWVLFSTDAGQALVNRFNEEQLELIVEYIEPKYWQFKVARQREDSAWVQGVFNSAGIKTYEPV